MPSEGIYEIFKRLFNLAEISKYKPNELLAYRDSLKDYRDYYNTIDFAEIKGRKEGREDTPNFRPKKSKKYRNQQKQPQLDGAAVIVVVKKLVISVSNQLLRESGLRFGDNGFQRRRNGTFCGRCLWS